MTTKSKNEQETASRSGQHSANADQKTNEQMKTVAGYALTDEMRAQLEKEHARSNASRNASRSPQTSEESAASSTSKNDRRLPSSRQPHEQETAQQESFETKFIE